LPSVSMQAKLDYTMTPRETSQLRRLDLVFLRNLKHRGMRFFSRRRFAISGLLAGRGRHLGQHRSLQLHAGPHLGHIGLRWHAWRLGQFGSSWGLRHRRGAGHASLGHLWLRHLRRRCHRGQGKALALDLVSFNHRLPEILHLHRRWRRNGSGWRLPTARRHFWSRRQSHRQNGRFFLKVIEQDSMARCWIGNHTGVWRVEAHFAVTGTPPARRRLRGLATSSRLHFCGAVGTRRRCRRRLRNLFHSGLSLARLAAAAE
jgi:hypothetical protein